MGSRAAQAGVASPKAAAPATFRKSWRVASGFEPGCWLEKPAAREREEMRRAVTFMVAMRVMDPICESNVKEGILAILGARRYL
jgi:hypothetical protein